MKISYLLPELGKTGGSIVLYNFMDQLVNRGHEVYAITPEKKIRWVNGIWKENLQEVNKLKISTLPKKILSKTIIIIGNQPKWKKYYIFLCLKKMTEGLLKNWEPSDITISTYSMTAYAGNLLANRSVSIYHMQHFEEVFFQNNIERQLARATYKMPLIKISNSSWLRNILNSEFNEESYLLNPGIDLSIFKHKEDYSKKYIEKKEWTVVSFFDENREWKGFNDAVEAVKLARKQLDNKNIKIKWKVYGLSAPKKQYDTEFEYVGKIFNRQLADFYSSADIVLLTSWYESFPLPPIEAMASGSLTISTKYGIEDYLTHKDNGLVVLPKRVDEIAEQLVWAINNPQKSLELVEKALETVLDFNWEKRTDVLESILLDAKNKYDMSKYQLFDDLVKGQFKEYMYNKFDY